MKVSGAVSLVFAAAASLVASAPTPQGILDGFFNFTLPSTVPIVPPNPHAGTTNLGAGSGASASTPSGPATAPGSGFQFRRSAMTGARTTVAYHGGNGKASTGGTNN